MSPKGNTIPLAMRNTPFLIWLLASCLLFSCSTENEPDPQEPQEDQSEEATGEDTEENPLVFPFQTAPLPPPMAGVDALFAEDVPYDQYADTNFDIFIPPSAEPTGLVIYIHGGGFDGGDKDFIYNNSFPDHIAELLENKVAVASINYRKILPGDSDGVLKSLTDSKRALQYIRSQAEGLNIDKSKVILFGSSAGASTALWIATNNEMAEPASTDAVLRESTRVQGIALNATQSSLDFEGRWMTDVFGEYDPVFTEVVALFGEAYFFSLYGVTTWEEYNTEEVAAYRAQIDMLSLISSDDPEIWVTNTGPANGVPDSVGSWNHHGNHAREIKEYADAAGVHNVAVYGDPILYADPSGEFYLDFIYRKLGL